MPDFLKKLDSSGRIPRQVQVDALTWLQDNWNTSQYFAMQLPVATGKSLISKAIMDATRGAIITPSNQLISQYTATYPMANYLKGKQHYQCSSGLSCKDWVDVLEQKACDHCPYSSCRSMASVGVPTIYNPMSLYYLMRSPQTAPSIYNAIVVDEAHQLPGMMMMMAGRKLRHSLYKFTDDCKSEVYLVGWLKETIRKLSSLATAYEKNADFKALNETTEELEGLRLTLQGLEEDPQNYGIWTETGTFRGKPETFLNIKPITPPKFLFERLLKGTKVIFMSGTLFPNDLKELTGGADYKLLDQESPIPKERRAILYRPTPFKMNRDTLPIDIVKAITKVLNEFPGLNTIIHTTYSMASKLIDKLPTGTICNLTSAEKEKCLEIFYNDGGIFLASGCAEGLDLKDNLCRLNIIPKLSYPDMGDPIVKKKMATEGGQEWYEMETLKVVIQQAGRSTRHESDWSYTVILDPNFARLVNKNRSRLPKSFLESIDWQGKVRKWA